VQTNSADSSFARNDPQRVTAFPLMSKLDRNLHVLAVCYRIAAGLLGLGFSLFIITMFGSSMLGGGVALVGVFLVLVLLLIGVAVVVALLEVASSLVNHERRTFCLVIAWLTCALFLPGLVLGVFTILQLAQPEAERAFAEAEPAGAKMENFGNQTGKVAAE